jgi:hypothetical protein
MFRRGRQKEESRRKGKEGVERERRKERRKLLYVLLTMWKCT